MDAQGQGDVSALDDLSEWTLKDDAFREFLLEGVRGVSSLVRTTYGPRGAEKLVETQTPEGKPEVVLSSDSGEIFAAIERGDGFNHPISALLVDSVDSMQRSLGDGGTAAAVLTAELVDRGVDLVESGLHPNVVTIGYAMAANDAGETLDALARPVDATDDTALQQVATTAMTAALDADVRREYGASIARAVRALAASSDDGFVDTDHVKVIGTTRHPTRLVDGIVVRQWPRGPELSEESNAEFDWEPVATERGGGLGVAVLDDVIDFEETATNLSGDMQSSGIKLESNEALENYTRGLERRIASCADRIGSLGVDLLVSQESVDDAVGRAFEEAGVMVLDGVDTPKIDIHRIAAMSGATVVSHPDDVTDERVGHIEAIRGGRVGDELWTVLEGGRAESRYTVVARAETETNAARIERLLSDALDVTALAAMDRQVLPGAGAPMVAVARNLRSYARGVSGVEQLAIEAFADAMEALVTVLAENSGLDKVDAVTTLRARHANAASGDDPRPIGVDLATGNPVDAYERGIVEPRRVFSQAIEAARTSAEHLLTTEAAYYPGVDLDSISPVTEHN